MSEYRVHITNIATDQTEIETLIAESATAASRKFRHMIRRWSNTNYADWLVVDAREVTEYVNDEAGFSAAYRSVS